MTNDLEQSAPRSHIEKRENVEVNTEEKNKVSQRSRSQRNRLIDGLRCLDT